MYSTMYSASYTVEKRNSSAFERKKNLARSVKERQSYRSLKSSGFERRLSPWGRADLTAPSGLLFDPDIGSFAYIPTGRCRRSTKADLLLFSVQISMRSVHWPCLLCSDTRRRSHVLKDNDWMLPEILERANSVGSGDVQLLWSTSGLWCLVWRLVESRSSNSLAQSR